MRVKSYRSSSTASALAKVKADLGSDAVILSNKTVEEDGMRFCEIMAAVEMQSEIPKQQDKTKDDLITEAMTDMSWTKEWDQIKSHLMTLMKPQMNLELLNPRQRLALDFLEREGVVTEVVLDVFRKLSAGPDQAVLPVLEDIVRTHTIDSGKWHQKMHALAGPHGVGKTSSLIRIALRQKKSNPKSRICLACADQGKGRLVLRHYAELSGLAFREIGSKEDFALLMEEEDKFDTILIDLPGLSNGLNLDQWLNKRGMNSNRKLAVHLVLNPFFCPRQLSAFVEKYKTPLLKSVIWTKLDEACTFGALLNVAHSSGLPVSNLSFGAGLKDSLVQAEDKMLWRLIFKHQLPGNENSLKQGCVDK